MTQISKQTQSCIVFAEHWAARIARGVFGFIFLAPGLYLGAAHFGLISIHSPDFFSAEWLLLLIPIILFILIGSALCFGSDKIVIDGDLQELCCIRNYLFYHKARRYKFLAFNTLEISRADTSGDTITPNYILTFVTAKRDIIIEVTSMASYKEIVVLAESISKISGLKLHNKELSPRQELQPPIPVTRAHDAP